MSYPLLFINIIKAVAHFKPSMLHIQRLENNSCAFFSSKNLAKSFSKNKDCDKSKCKPQNLVLQARMARCCLNKCKDASPRFDTLYYKPSDKRKRKYQKNWRSCTKIVRPKCVYCGPLPKPPFQKRKKEERIKSACSRARSDRYLMRCNILPNHRPCPKFNLKVCDIARKPPVCKPTKKPANCKKETAPLPSFSECKPPIRPPVNNECHCIKPLPMCELWREYRKRLKHRQMNEIVEND